jgi:hypothetical protein
MFTFTRSRSDTLEFLKGLGNSLCCYAGGDWLTRRCDCKYNRDFRKGYDGGEQTGCPEIRDLYRLVSTMTDVEYEMLMYNIRPAVPAAKPEFGIV